MRINAKKDRSRFVALLGGHERASAALKSLEAKLGHRPTLRNILICVHALETDPAIVETENGEKITAMETEEGRAIINIVQVLGPVVASKPKTISAPARTTPPSPAPAKPFSAREKKENAARLLLEYRRLDHKSRAAFVKERNLLATLNDPEVEVSKALLRFVERGQDVPPTLLAGFGVTTKNAGAK
jgi:hypothetical protein